MLKSCASSILSVAKATYNNNLLKCIPKAACSQERFASILSNPFVPAKSALLPVQKVSIVPAANIYRMFKPVATQRKVWFRKVKNYKTVTDTPFESHRVYRFDRSTGKRTSCKAVEERFFRLAWGGWIRTIEQKDKNLHKKGLNAMRRMRQHFLCNAKQSTLLDAMAGPWFLRRHYYVDDPYEPYHNREHYLTTRKKPLPPS